VGRRALGAATLAAVGTAGLFAAGSVSAKYSASTLLGLASSPSAAVADPVIAVAGDSCGDPTSCAPTASVIDQINPDAAHVGDNAYEDGTLAEYNSYYKPNWGRFDAKVYLAPGNHDFHTANSEGYRDYFGARAPALYYSYDLGSWHLISLPGDDTMDASAGSPQEIFLRNDLAAHRLQCTLVYWHEPRWSSGNVHGNDSGESAIWNDLYDAGVDVGLNGHDHNYQRFGHLSKTGTPDPAGAREFVVGTGGWGHYGFTSSSPQPEVERHRLRRAEDDAPRRLVRLASSSRGRHLHRRWLRHLLRRLASSNHEHGRKRHCPPTTTYEPTPPRRHLDRADNHDHADDDRDLDAAAACRPSGSCSSPASTHAPPPRASTSTTSTPSRTPTRFRPGTGHCVPGINTAGRRDLQLGSDRQPDHHDGQQHQGRPEGIRLLHLGRA
jgi:hypothetical protein